MNPKSASDELLRIKADAILDNIRVLRVKLARARSGEHGNSGLLFEEHKDDFNRYISKLPDYERIMSEMIPADYVLYPSTDAMCMDTSNGPIIVISEVLRYFLYYMNLANLDLPGVSESVRGHARVIAVRTMFMVESLDFDIDPRGNVPQEIDAEVKGMVDWQLQWLIGHELAHHYLNHVGFTTEGFRYSKALAAVRGHISEKSIQTRSWEQEFEADEHAISAPKYDNSEQYSIVVSALMLLSYVAMFEKVAEFFDPELENILTHPPIKDRMIAIVEKFGNKHNIDMESVEIGFNWHLELAKNLIELGKANPSIYKNYGSVYLAEWQGPVLRDRIDY